MNPSRPEDEEAVGVVSTIVDQLKDHQKTGVRFLWQNTVTSFEMARKGASGGGCILAHCMGLGKTLTTIVFTLTLLSSPLITAIKDPTALAEQIESQKVEAKMNAERKAQRKNEKKQAKDDLKLMREVRGLKIRVRN
jgi:SNF2 family DNA or RNA helicase